MSGFGTILGLYARRAVAYRWIVLVPTVLVFALVTFYLMIQPDVYESYAVLMAPIVDQGADAVGRDARQIQRNAMRSASERLLSTRMLLRVIDDIDPYPTLRDTKGIEEVVEELRKHIRIDLNHRSGTITVVCSHSEGDRPAETAAKIVNLLTQQFTDVQREALREKAMTLKQFLDREKTRLRKSLDAAQANLDAFKAAHAGELPEDREANLSRIDRLNQQLVNYQMTKRQYEFQIENLNREMKRLETDLVLLAEGRAVRTDTALQASERTLQALELQLRLLRTKFSDDSAQVKAKAAEVEAVRRQIEEERKNTRENKSAKSREEYTRYVIDYNRKLIANFRDEITRLDKVAQETKQAIETARQRLLTASKIESAYLSLQRAVAEASKKYDSIVLRHARACEASNYDKYYGTVPIQIEQSAFVPSKPASPDRLLTSLIGLVLGLGIGVGLAVATSRLDRSYQRPEELRSLLPGAVLVTIPEVRSGSARAGRAFLGILAGLLLLGVFCAAVGALGIQAGWWGEPGMLRPLTMLR